MRFWFGRKSAAADVRPCVPAWLGTDGRGGFARLSCAIRGGIPAKSRRAAGGSPVDLQAEVQGDGALSLAWTRRSRLGWNWPSADPPLGESAERYRVTVQGSAATLTLAASEPRAVISADSLVGMSGSMTITVVQIGDFAESRPVTATITF